MELFYHPRVSNDIREILDWYDARSNTAGDRFFADFERTVEDLLTGKRQGYPIDSHAHKILLAKFPYALAYEVVDEILYIFVVKHQKRQPSYGMRRRRPSQNH